MEAIYPPLHWCAEEVKSKGIYDRPKARKLRAGMFCLNDPASLSRKANFLKPANEQRRVAV
jgi:hypothetical protein